MMSKKNSYAFSKNKKSNLNPKKSLQKVFNKSIAFHQQGRTEKALEVTLQALDSFPQNAALLRNAGAFANLLEKLDLSKKYTLKSLKSDPSSVDAHNNLAIVLKKQNNQDEAKKHYQIALELNPNHADTYYNLGNLFLDQNNQDEAKKHYQIALELNPNHFNAQWNLSFLLLRFGQYQQAWKLYESRYHEHKKDRNSIPPEINIPQYHGEDLTNKTILVYHEQGFGDEIQFIRYLPLLKEQKKVKGLLLVCKPPLKKLFSSVSCIDHLLDESDFRRVTNIQGLDYWVFIMSLPLYFGTTLENIPNHLPYLSTDKDLREYWQKKIPKVGFKVGLVWKGRPTHTNDKYRSIPSLTTLKPLWQLSNKMKNKINIRFISLQKGAGENELVVDSLNDQPIIDLGKQVKDFSDSAAIVSQLDLIICVDTAIAHLSGSLNIPCWVLLPFHNPDWRWMLDRDDSPWYPGTMQLFRRTSNGNWGNVIDSVVKSLELTICEKYNLSRTT